MSMAAGVEVRVPLLDPDLVRLAFSLPLDLKQRGRMGKWVFTEAMRGILPDEILQGRANEAFDILATALFELPCELADVDLAGCQIDVHQGPLERAYGLGTLVLHTAGNHNASVSLPGISHHDALAMREDIRAHLKRETM